LKYAPLSHGLRTDGRWGLQSAYDITLWEKINALADREPPLVKIEGPNARLPQWEGLADLKLFRVYPTEQR